MYHVNVQAENITSNDAYCLYNQLLVVISLEGILPSFDAYLWNDPSFKGGVFQSVIALQAFNVLEQFSTRVDKLSLCCLCFLHPRQGLLTSSAS